MRALKDEELSSVIGGVGAFGSATQVMALSSNYNMNLTVLVASNSNFLNNIPQSGNYSGNGSNDWWNKMQALNETFNIYPHVNIAATHSPENLALGQRIENDYRQTMMGLGDPDHITPQNTTLDSAAERHDQYRGVDSYLGNISGVIQDDISFGLTAIASFFSDGNVYDIAAAGFIGIATVGLDILQGVEQMFGFAQVSQAANEGNGSVSANALATISAFDTIANDNIVYSNQIVYNAAQNEDALNAMSTFADESASDVHSYSGIDGIVGGGETIFELAARERAIDAYLVNNPGTAICDIPCIGPMP